MMNINLEDFVEILFMIQLKRIMRLKRKMKMIILIIMLRVFGTDYETLLLTVRFILFS